MAVLHLLAHKRPASCTTGLTADRSRHRLRRRRHRPRHRHRPRGRQRHHRDGAPARVGRHGPHHDVPRHRVHRGARALRLRPRVHHLGLKHGRSRTVRTRISAARSRSLGVAVVVLGASPRRRSRRTTDAEVRRRGRRRSASSSLEERQTVDDCQKAPNPLLPGDERDHLGRARVRRAALRSCGSSRVPAVQEHGCRRVRTASATTSRAPSRRQDRSRDRARAVPGAARRGATTEAGPHHRGGAPVGRRASRQRPERSAEAEAARDRGTRAQADIASPARARRWPTCAPRSPTSSIELAERIVEHNLDRDTQTQLVESYINQVGSN